MSPIVPEPNSTRLPGSGVDGAADFLNRLVRADQRSVRQLESVQREVSEPDRVFVDFIYGASGPAPLFQMAEAAICCDPDCPTPHRRQAARNEFFTRSGQL